ncbi:L-histidine N(alpha)-methyltransferase [Brevundimonas sp.]|uniref:L-histidine N(alpha)-methyltransferase n=1 Tax=Brevundimonas sp. TaxID=1871086 RepID=UPI00289908D0|nr:L-histidine N(alpha)-methyltransferase [Brevundimonas sp.]
MQTFRSDLIAGLSASPKSLSPKWFYDAEGSRLFEHITQLDEYYPTRQETTLLRQTIPLWLDLFGPDAVLVELGSGASAKTRILLDAISDLAAYVPLDISDTALEAAARALRRDYPRLDIRPVSGDFENLPNLPDDLPKGRRIGFFPGSTIGNLDHQAAVELLIASRRMLGSDSLFILGIDLIKDRETLLAAYDDRQGVTSAFNMNLLHRANRELGTDFDTDAFRHRAVWNDKEARIEMHLESLKDQNIQLDGQKFLFQAGETLHTENSHKFDRARVQALAEASGWTLREMRISAAPYVALALLQPTE